MNQWTDGGERREGEKKDPGCRCLGLKRNDVHVILAAGTTWSFKAEGGKKGERSPCLPLQRVAGVVHNTPAAPHSDTSRHANRAKEKEKKRKRGQRGQGLVLQRKLGHNDRYFATIISSVVPHSKRAVKGKGGGAFHPQCAPHVKYKKKRGERGGIACTTGSHLFPTLPFYSSTLSEKMRKKKKQKDVVRFPRGVGTACASLSRYFITTSCIWKEREKEKRKRKRL